VKASPLTPEQSGQADSIYNCHIETSLFP